MQVSQLLFLVLSTAMLGACGSLRDDVTSLECGETISLDFSGEVPLVNCSSACPGDMQTWSAGPVYKRSTTLSPMGLMIKMKYSYSGVKCSIIESASDKDLLEKYREESGICDPFPATLQTTSTIGVITGSSATVSDITTGIASSETTTSSGVETAVSTVSETSTEQEPSQTSAASAGITATETASEKTDVSEYSESDSGSTVVTITSSAFTEPATTPEATTTSVPETDEPEETTMQGCGNNGENNNDQKELVSTIEPTTTTTTVPTTTTTTTTTTTEPPTTTTTTPAPVIVCPDGWSRFVDSCYHISSERGSWDSGLKYCKNIGGSYVTITSSDEQRFVASILNHSSWIGYNDRSKEGKFVWASGETSSYEAFGKGEPNGVSRPEDCVEMRKEVGYRWNDVSCSFRKYYACETGLVVQK